MGKTVLIVDDSATVRQQVRMVLSQAGFEVMEAADGAEGAEVVDRSPEIACVLCDVNMPRLNGIDFVRRVKAQARHSGLPIVMLTTEGQPALVAAAKQAGAKGWIVKPFKPEMLVAAIQRLAA